MADHVETRFLSTIPVIHVEDLAAAMAFYTEKLGFAVSFVSEWAHNGVKRGGIELHIGQGSTRPNPPSANIYFVVEGIDALREEFLRSGAISAETAVIEQPYGARELHVKDPFGNHLGFSEMQG